MVKFEGNKLAKHVKLKARTIKREEDHHKLLEK